MIIRAAFERPRSTCCRTFSVDFFGSFPKFSSFSAGLVAIVGSAAEKRSRKRFLCIPNTGHNPRNGIVRHSQQPPTRSTEGHLAKSCVRHHAVLTCRPCSQAPMHFYREESSGSLQLSVSTNAAAQGQQQRLSQNTHQCSAKRVCLGAF